MSENRRGVALVVSAPSGAGKTTLIKRLLQEFPQFCYSVSCTTRPPRKGEVDGRDYHFMDREEFERRVAQGYFAEWAEVHGNLYGTPLAEVREALDAGRDMLFDIDVQGALQVKEKIPGCYVFVFPPSLDELRSRLSSRGSDDADTIARRLANARGEVEQAKHFEYWVVNDDLDEAYDELRAAYLAEALRPARRPGFLNGLLAQWDDGKPGQGAA